MTPKVGEWERCSGHQSDGLVGKQVFVMRCTMQPDNRRHRWCGLRTRLRVFGRLAYSAVRVLGRLLRPLGGCAVDPALAF